VSMSVMRSSSLRGLDETVMMAGSILCTRLVNQVPVLPSTKAELILLSRKGFE
jgi:hypothetical protein